jgi:hypothetical protein
MGRKDEETAPAVSPSTGIKINAKTVGIAGVSAAGGALALMATRGATGLTTKNAKMGGALIGLVLGYYGAQRMEDGKSFLPFGKGA